MRTNHVDKLVEAYLDDQLSLELRQQVEIHIKICPICAQLLFDARRLKRELGPILRATLGQPLPPPMLRQKVRQTLEETQTTRPFYLRWTTPAQIFNAVGNAALIALLTFGVVIVTRGQIPGINLLSTSSSMTLPGSSDNGQIVARITATVPAPSPTPVPATDPTRSTPSRSSLGDTIDLSRAAPPQVTAVSEPTLTSLSSPLTNAKIKEEVALQALSTPANISPTATSLPLPGGTIAYALFDFTPGVEMYQIHLINPDGSNHRYYSIKGVSEPALHPDNNEYALAMRTWFGNSYPRKLLTSDGAAGRLQPITHFWEDAQPDWSPTENRIIFASQRESDRRWRLYTAWGDGSFEMELRREGRSPSFAPDGHRFAFESCEDTGDRCGLWLADLDNSEYGARLFLPDPSAKSPDWSPTSEEIAYMSNPAGNWELYLVNSDGSHLRRLTDTPDSDGLPAWSPDGEWLAFVSDREGSWGLWLLHVSSGTLHKTTTFGESSLTPLNSQPYNEHGQRHWWDEQISWGP
jgi:hypothetical protein